MVAACEPVRCSIPEKSIAADRLPEIFRGDELRGYGRCAQTDPSWRGNEKAHPLQHQEKTDDATGGEQCSGKTSGEIGVKHDLRANLSRNAGRCHSGLPLIVWSESFPHGISSMGWRGENDVSGDTGRKLRSRALMIQALVESPGRDSQA
jgi:hypothetical protein